MQGSDTKTWSCKEKTDKDEQHRKLDQEETKDKSLFVNFRLQLFRPYVKGKHSAGKEAVDIGILITSRSGNRKIKQPIRIRANCKKMNIKISKKCKNKKS